MEVFFFLVFEDCVLISIFYYGRNFCFYFYRYYRFILYIVKNVNKERAFLFLGFVLLLGF